jgi:hypothetical protein
MKNKLLIISLVWVSIFGVQAQILQDFIFVEEKIQEEKPSELFYNKSDKIINYSISAEDDWSGGGTGAPDPGKPGGQSTEGVTSIGSAILPLCVCSILFIVYLYITSHYRKKRKY